MNVVEQKEHKSEILKFSTSTPKLYLRTVPD